MRYGERGKRDQRSPKSWFGVILRANDAGKSGWRVSCSATVDTGYLLAPVPVHRVHLGLPRIPAVRLDRTSLAVVHLTQLNHPATTERVSRPVLAERGGRRLGSLPGGDGRSSLLS